MSTVIEGLSVSRVAIVGIPSVETAVVTCVGELSVNYVDLVSLKNVENINI